MNDKRMCWCERVAGGAGQRSTSSEQRVSANRREGEERSDLEEEGKGRTKERREASKGESGASEADPFARSTRRDVRDASIERGGFHVGAPRGRRIKGSS